MTDTDLIDALDALNKSLGRHRFVSILDAAALTGLSADEIRAAYRAGQIKGRTQRQQPSGRVHAYQVLLGSVYDHVDRVAALDAQGRRTDDVIHRLRTGRTS